mmetsp:Transcript_18287/g.34808  ORF Transcript_18287/g.34808 Transcript_18287/m.34808 type:complete len:923 (-) Transcript_18287:284-3052(-)
MSGILSWAFGQSDPALPSNPEERVTSLLSPNLPAYDPRRGSSSVLGVGSSGQSRADSTVSLATAYQETPGSRGHSFHPIQPLAKGVHEPFSSISTSNMPDMRPRLPLPDAPLATLQPALRRERLQMWLRQLGNREDEVLSSKLAAEEIATAATVAVVRTEINGLMRENPSFLLFLMALVDSTNVDSSRAAIRAICALVNPIRSGVGSMVHSAMTRMASSDGLMVIGYFLLADKMVPVEFGELPWQVITDMILRMCAMLDDDQVSLECANVLRSFLCATVDVWERMTLSVSIELFMALAALCKSKDPDVFLEGANAAQWMSKHNARTMERVVRSLQYPHLLFFVEAMTQCVLYWQPHVHGAYNPIQGDAGAVWGLLTELASLPIGRHSLLFMVAGLGNMAADPRQAQDSAMKDFVYPYQEACASLVMVVTEALLHPRTAVLAAYLMDNLLKDMDVVTDPNHTITCTMSGTEIFLCLHPDNSEVISNLAEAFRSLSEVDRLGAEACLRCLGTIMDPDQLKRWVVVHQTARGMHFDHMHELLLAPMVKGLVCVIKDLAEETNGAGPTMAPAHLSSQEVMRASNRSAHPFATPTDTKQLNDTFRNSQLPARWLLVQVIVAGLHPLIFFAPKELVALAPKEIGQTLAEALSLLCCVCEVPWIHVHAAQVLAVIGTYGDPSVLTAKVARCLILMLEISMTTLTHADMGAAAMHAVFCFTMQAHSENRVIELLKGGGGSSGWFSSMMSQDFTCADMLCYGLLSALRSDDLRVVDQALQVIVRIMVNKDRFGYSCMARQPIEMLVPFVARLSVLLTQAIYLSCGGRYAEYMLGMQRNACLVLQALLASDHWANDNPMRKAVDALCEPDFIAAVTALRHLQMSADKECDKMFVPATSTLATEVLNKITTRGRFSSEWNAKCMQRSLWVGTH